MGLFLQNGTRVTQSTISTAVEADPLVVIGTDLYLREKFNDNDKKNPAGSKLTLFCRAGKVMRTSEVTNLFPDPVVDLVSPATGAAAGGTVVTFTGKNLDGVTAITFGGTPGTVLTVVSPTEVRVTTPAMAAGAYDVVVTDDGGSVTLTGAYTYA